MDRNQFMRDLCELVNSDPILTASTYLAFGEAIARFLVT